MTVVMVGLNRPFVEAIEADLGPGGLVVVESRDAIERRGLAPFVAAHPVIAGVVEADHQRVDLDIAELDARLPADVRAVVPGLEYSVRTAARLAARRGLPGAGPRAGELLQDKAGLRAAHAGSRYAVPAWEVTTAQEVADLLAAHPGGVVLKPHNRQACAGVTRLRPGDDVDAAFARVLADDVQVDTVAERPKALVEALAVGHQTSAEALVRDGRVVFLNVTDTLVRPGPWPLLLGQAVPSTVGTEARRHIAAAIDELIAVVGVHDGLLHAEFLWDDTQGVLRLIECAGRPPGDRVVECIDAAYGTNLHLALVQVLSGRAPDLPAPPDRPVAGAAVRFLDVPGTAEVLDVLAPDLAHVTQTPGVRADVQVHLAHRGAGGAASGWERLANVFVVADDVAAAAAHADALLSSFVVHTAHDAEPEPTLVGSDGRPGGRGGHGVEDRQ